MLRSDYASTLRELVDPASLPRAFGGADDCGVGEAPEELALRRWVVERCSQGLDDVDSSPSLAESDGEG